MFVTRHTVRRLPLSQFVAHEFHSSTPTMKNDLGVLRSARMLKKMMTGSNKPKKKFFNLDLAPSKQFAELQFLNPAADKKSSISSRAKKRVNVLNVLFIEQVTSLLSTGEIDPEIIDLGLSISSIKISSNFKAINIYWEPSGTKNDDILEKKLPHVAGILRHHLHQLRVCGCIPPIHFVKDPFKDKLAQVERALETCDFGPDFEPTHMSTLVKNMKPIPVSRKETLNVDKISKAKESLPKEEKEVQLENEEISTDENILNQSLDDILHGPEMRNDILDLDHTNIMNKIILAVQREDARKSKSVDPVAPSYEISQVDDGKPPAVNNIFEPETQKERTKMFLKYLKQKRILKEKEMKRLSSDTSEREFQKELIHERTLRYQDSLLDQAEEEFRGDDDHKDYIEDDYRYQQR